MNTWRTLLPHELDDIEKKIEAGEALDIGLLRSLVTMARNTRDVAAEDLERQREYDRGFNDGYDKGRNRGYDEGYDDSCYYGRDE